MRCASCGGTIWKIECPDCGRGGRYCENCNPPPRTDICPYPATGFDGGTCGSPRVMVSPTEFLPPPSFPLMTEHMSDEVDAHSSGATNGVGAASCPYAGSDDPSSDDSSEVFEEEDLFVVIHYLDVGMGDSTLIIDWHQGTVIMIDCGTTKNRDAAAIPNLQVARDQITAVCAKFGRAPTIDLFFITHPDRDHYNLIPALIADVFGGDLTISQFVIGGEAGQYRSRCSVDGGSRSMAPLLGGARQFSRAFVGSENFRFPNIVCTVICANQAPLHGATRANAVSLCILVTVATGRGMFKALFVGDAEQGVEEVLVARCSAAITRCDSVKVGHHGSRAACTQPFLDVVQPRYAFISADMTWSHPYTDTVVRLIRLGSLQQCYELDPPHEVVSGEGGSRGRQYQTHTTATGVYGNMTGFHTDTSGSDAARTVERAGDTPIVAEGQRIDFYIFLVDGATEVRHSGQSEDDDVIDL